MDDSPAGSNHSVERLQVCKYIETADVHQQLSVNATAELQPARVNALVAIYLTQVA
jgi:hypothetical protein